MTTSLRFFVPGLPRPGGSKKGFVSKSGRVCIVEDAKRNKDWRASVALAAHEAMRGSAPMEGALRLVIVFHMPRPKGHFGSGKNAGVLKANAPVFCTSKPDSTKLVRSTEDAMTGIVWRDDAQVAEQAVLRRFANGPAGADVTVEVIG